MEKKNLPVGIEFYKKIIDEAYYYVDKTLMIKRTVRPSALCEPFYKTEKIRKDTGAGHAENLF